MFGAAIWIYTHIEPGMIEQNDAVDGTVVLHLKSRSVTSFSFGVEKNSMAPAHSFVAAWPSFCQG